MRGDIDLREIKLNKVWLSRRNTAWLAAVVVVVAAGALTWRFLTHPPRAWIVRWKLDRYLKNESHASSFKVDFPFPSKAEMVKPPVFPTEPAPKIGSRTGKSFDALREEYLSLKTAAVGLERIIVRGETELKDASAQLDALAKQTSAPPAGAEVSNVESNTAALRDRVAELRKTTARRSELREKEQVIAPIEDDLWEFQHSFAAEAGAAANSALVKARTELTSESEKKLASAASYDAMYKIIGQELFVAKGLLASGNTEHRKQGLTLALSASQHATTYAINGNVAARICEGYLLPNLGLANDTNRRSLFNEDNLLGQIAATFQRNFEYHNVVRTYQIYLAGVKNAQRADWARSQIGSAYDQAGDPKHALETYRQIRDTNSYRNIFIRQVPRLEKQLKG